MEFSKLTKSEFDHFQKSCPCANFLQSVEMFDRYKARNNEVYLVGLKAKKTLLIATLVVSTRTKFGKKIFKTPGGPLLDYDEKNAQSILKTFTKELKKFLKTKNGLVLEISPNIISQPRDINNQIIPGKNHLKIKTTLEALGYKYLGEYDQAKWLFILETKNKDPEKLLKSFRTTHRQCIGYAKRDGVKIRELKLDELPILKKMTAASGAHHHFQDPELPYYQEMKKHFKDKVKFMVAEVEIDGKITPINAAMFMFYGPEIVYLYSGSLDQYRKYNGSVLLQWEMINRAIKDGYERYNFYGVYPKKGNGVYQFKQGFKGTVVELLGTFILPLSLKGFIYTKLLKPREFGEII